MRSSLLCSSLLVALVVAPPAFATVSVLSGDPPADLASLITAERNFAARAAETSIRDAFYEAMDDHAIVFRPGPVNAREFYHGRPSNPGPLLSWGPSYAEISAYGDLGWTFGPWTYKGPKDKEPTAFGHFATVWQYGIDRKWHVLIDHGNSHPRGPDEPLTFARVGGEKTPHEIVGLIDFVRGVHMISSADSAYSQALTHEGVKAALERCADPDVRVLRDELAPLVGAEAAGKALAHEWDHGAVAWGMTAGSIAKSGDLGFTYGTVDLPAGKMGEPTKRNIFRVWRKAPGEGWKLALDVTTPFPPDAAETAPPPPADPAPKKP
jgi:ketosteroid isomerase-like protein